MSNHDAQDQVTCEELLSQVCSHVVSWLFRLRRALLVCSVMACQAVVTELKERVRRATLAAVCRAASLAEACAASLLFCIIFDVDASVCGPIGPLQLKVVVELRTQTGAHQHCVKDALVVHSMHGADRDVRNYCALASSLGDTRSLSWSQCCSGGEP